MNMIINAVLLYNLELLHEPFPCSREDEEYLGNLVPHFHHFVNVIIPILARKVTVQIIYFVHLYTATII